MGLLILSVLVVAFVSEININFWIMMQLIFSLLIAALFLLKFLFVKYGFIGKRLTNT
jgi:hypothetical protein